jgi:hypothetical protein
MKRLLTGLVAASVCAGGCSTYDHRYVYEPSPADVETDVGEGSPLHALVTVLGLRRADADEGIPSSIDLRMELENAGSEPVTLEPAALALYAADLTRFADPEVEPAGPVEIAPQGTALVEARFAFPEGRDAGDVDLSGLRLRWTVDTPGGTVTAGCGFTQRPNAYYDRYPDRIGVGYQRFDS